MQKAPLSYMNLSIFVVLAFFAIMGYTGSALAGDSMMQQNCQNLSDLTSKWSNQLKSGKITPEAQEKLAELLAETSQVLRDMSEKSGEQMQVENSMKIEKMKKEWDPFDTSGKM